MNGGVVKTEMTCIQCPLGCRLMVESDGDQQILSIQGNTCGRGPKYAADELKHPKRMVCSTVRVEGARYGVVSVKTQQAVPKDQIFSVMEVIRKIGTPLPVHAGEVIVENIAGTGVNLVATENKD